VVNGHPSAVAQLLCLGADKTVVDAAGETALAMAERRALCGAAAERAGARGGASGGASGLGGLGSGGGAAAAASTFGGIAKLLGGSGATKNLKQKGHRSAK